MNLKKDQTIYTILLIIGIIISIGSIVLANMSKFEFIGGISGLGGAWIAISVMKLYQIRKKPKKVKEQIIEQYDERNIAIRGYAGYATFITTLLTISIMTFIFMMLNCTWPIIIGVGLMLTHIISYLFFIVYYSKKNIELGLY